MDANICFFTILNVIIMSSAIASPEPEQRDCSRYAFQHKLLESLVHLEHSVTIVRAEVDTLKESVEKIQSGYYGNNRKAIAFTVVLDSEKQFREGDTLKFTKVLNNAGTGYNVDTGMFTAPVSGTYIFAFQIEHWETTEISAHVMLENVLQCSAALNPDGTSEQSSGTVVISLQTGQSVWIKIKRGGKLYGSETFYGTAFSGAYLY